MADGGIDRWARPVAVTVVVVGLMCAVVAVLAPLLSDRVTYEDTEQGFLSTYIAYLAGGAVITLARARNGVGWCLLWLGFSTLVASAIDVLKPLVIGPGPTWWLGVASGLTSSAVAFLFPLTLLIFPTGRLLSPRWRWARNLSLVAGVIGIAAGGLSGQFGGHSSDSTQDHVTPVAVPWAGLIGVLEAVFTPVMLVGFFAAGVSMVMRYRRSRGDERQQLRWLAFSAGLLLAVLVLDLLVIAPLAGELDSEPLTYIVIPVFCLVPLSVAVAVLKYRLYDIDIVISRSVVFGGLAGFITVVYALVVVGIGGLLAPGVSLELSVLATAVVAFAFEPVRVRLQHLANRLVYGRRATPYEVLTRLTAGFAEPAELVDPAAGTHASDPTRLADLLAAGTGAVEAAVWLRVGERLRRLGGPTAEVTVTGDELPDLATDHAVAVRDTDGGLLGALTIVKARGDAVTTADRRLLEDVAGGAALLLRNRRLQAELREHAERLRESRIRLVAGQDAERRRLERDLHDGAQQHLVALKLKLGLAATLARREGAEDLAGELAALGEATQTTVDAVRAIARSLYPPLLEVEGLPTAITGASRLAGVPVTVHAEGVGRLDRVVESTVYFGVVEAMTNAVAHGAPGAIQIDLAVSPGGGGQVSFSVTDDGRGFDPAVSDGPGAGGLAALADRLDVLGGTLEIRSAPGAGTTVSGHVPLPAPAGTGAAEAVNAVGSR